MSLPSAFWFDCVVVVVLFLGFKIGQYKEARPKILNAIHCALTLVVCVFIYKAPSLWLAKRASIQPDVMALIFFPIAFLLVFALLSIVMHRIAARLSSEETDGAKDQKMTKIAGAIRFLVFLFIAMAWLSGKNVTEQDLKDHEAWCRENFGSITFPSISTLHHDIFKGSYTGMFAKRFLSPVMLAPLPRVDYGEKASTVAAKKPGKQLRELNSDFERESPTKAGKETVQTTREREPVTEQKPAAEQNSASANNPANRIVYHDISLRGISGSGANLFAMINDQTFRAGDSNNIRYEDRKITLRCLKVMQDSATVTIEGHPDPIELKLGVPTDLKGQPIQGK